MSDLSGALYLLSNNEVLTPSVNLLLRRSAARITKLGLNHP